MTSQEPLIFEVTLGPSTPQLIKKIIIEMNYLQIPVIALLAIHILSFFILIKYRNNLLVTEIHFLVCCFFIAVSNCLNDFLSTRWEKFLFKQNYFDPNCIFVFTFWTVPFSVVAIVIIFSLFIDLCKSIAVHRYFDSFMKHEEVVEAPQAKDAETKEKAD
ncbi:hypothetical protein TRFO_26578 [Tritrichomonas foetus]|uniref:Uncharacterized protein n=1 Tax=Tritrichomonas foetus TaxID=1144522 RepID=A0A1J4K7D7_9EUKA|nr:hypothetical protein TRFO_26578 [Tritrichomonas foetus]|eukprot:OHT05628.1 hypothetical protein TRFO_26578 [Tritrichomonas foetus]